MFEEEFFGPQARPTLESALDTLFRALPQQPYQGGEPVTLAALLKAPVCPPLPTDFTADLEKIIQGAIAVWHPFTAAHLHTPVLKSAWAAEAILTALNPSMDSFDQAPMASIVELQVTEWLCRELVGWPAESAGTFTAGGTQSNYMGLLLARDHFLQTRWHWQSLTDGLPPEAQKLRILCSEMAHFSAEKAAIQLGLGTKAVVRVPVDSAFRLQPAALRAALESLEGEGLAPMAIVATAGTTDFGSIDPLQEIGEIAAEFGLWLHVDAAYGGALLLSELHRPKFAGIAAADSVTIDFHKAFFQPISCSAFLLKDAARFDLIRVHADYLNPESHADAGIPDLVTRSVLTTRRFDALKIWMSFQSVGRLRFAQMVERLVDLAGGIAKHLEERPDFEVLNPAPEFGCVVFRYTPAGHPDLNRLNYELPRRLFTQGRAVVGHTQIGGQECLKFTLNNPCIELDDLIELVELIAS